MSPRHIHVRLNLLFRTWRTAGSGAVRLNVHEGPEPGDRRSVCTALLTLLSPLKREDLCV